MEVRNAERLTPAEIVERLDLPAKSIVILSGGNPALHKLLPLVALLHDRGAEVHVETQGSRWADWFAEVDQVVVSPKPPSSGMSDKTDAELPLFMDEWRKTHQNNLVLKMVVGDQRDLGWSLRTREAVDPFGELPFYLSALTPPQASLHEVAASYQQLCELVTQSDTARKHDPVVLPQLHVIAWGHRQGV
jgi:7-carboxy-7-deazaguanine synthase